MCKRGLVLVRTPIPAAPRAYITIDFSCSWGSFGIMSSMHTERRGNLCVLYATQPKISMVIGYTKDGPSPNRSISRVN